MVGRALLFALLALAASPAAAQPNEERAVLAAVQAFFDALETRDEARILATIVPEGTITGHGRRKAVPQTWREWLKDLGNGKERLQERMHDPEVRIRGTLASVWTPYTFHVDGTFSHCGYDNFDLAKVDGRWKVVNLSFTVETKGCSRR